MTYQLKAKDREGRDLAVFSPTFEGGFREALMWFSSRDWILNNPNVDSMTIERVNLGE